MEWVILVLLVPAVLLPVVLLFGFAGCNQVFGNDPTVLIVVAPVDLLVTTIDVNVIRLTWNSGEPGATFQIERTKEGDSPVILPGKVTTSNFDDVGADLMSTGLEVGTTYFYRVRAIRPTDHAESAWSSPGNATTFVFNGKLSPNLGAGSDQADLQGSCIVTRIPAPSPQGKTWPRVKITLRGSTVGALTIDRLSVSLPADIDVTLPPTSREAWDSYLDLTIVATGEGASGESVDLPAGVTKSFTLNYAVDGSRDLLIAFDINPTLGQGNVRFGPLFLTPPPRSYFKGPPSGGQIAEAGNQNRASDFLPSPAHYLVETIDVA